MAHVDKVVFFFIVDLFVDKRFSGATKLQNLPLRLNLRLRQTILYLPVRLQKPNM